MQFVDTNVLLYAVSRDPAEELKAVRARAVLTANIGLSVQVLQEFYVQTTRPSRTDRLTPAQARDLVESFLRFPVQVTTAAVVMAAIETQRRFDISYWDAAILEAARELGCDIVLSEDLADGQDYAGVRVIDPFRDSS